MKLEEAIMVLGINPKKYFRKLSESSLQERIVLSNKMLEECRRRQKLLLRDSHPDRGGNPEVFKSVSLAFSVVEVETSKFISRLNQSIQDREERLKNQVLISKS